MGNQSEDALLKAQQNAGRQTARLPLSSVPWLWIANLEPQSWAGLYKVLCIQKI